VQNASQKQKAAKPVQKQEKAAKPKKDPAGLIEKEVRKETGKPKGELTEEDFNKIERLSALNCEHISEIPVTITKLKNLKWLPLAYNEITDINILRKLPRLKELDLAHNNIREIKAISHLENLNDLNLSHNLKLRDFSPLAKLKKLRKLDISYNNLTDLKILGGHLSKCKSLRVLKLSINDITSTRGLEGLTNLQELDLHFNKELSDIRGLECLANLKVLNLKDTGLELSEKPWFGKSPLVKLQEALPNCNIEYSAAK
tara:strand:- start:186 stop:959 length:774 start_codon:yes stop_codon:yes gene_type:complete